MTAYSTNSILGNGFSSTQKNNLLQVDKKTFSFQCQTLNKGKIIQKEENTPLGKAVYQYSYDSEGHLTDVVRNGKLIEGYKYNSEGQRVEDHRTDFGGSRHFIYSHDNALIRVNDVYLDWTPSGQLKAIYSQNERIEYEYGNDTRLDKVFLSSGDVIQYEYANELMPVKVLAGYELTFEYSWKDSFQLQRCVDIQSEVTYAFAYGNARTPESVTIQGQPQTLQRLAGQFTPSLKLKIWADQIGSIRALSTDSGAVIKYLEYDAFGNITLDTKPEWEFPLGFAGGLNDFYTRFVRFGFRDYDPQVGRFTAKDPIGDTGGDHDLWDYCVDDPVNRIDPSGQNWAAWIWGTIGDKVAAYITKEIIDPKEANSPEQLIDVKVKINTLLDKINDGHGNDKDVEMINKLRHDEKELEKKWGKYFGNDINKIVPKYNPFERRYKYKQ